MMQGQKDNEQQKSENTVLELAALTVLGDRKDQQDSFGFELKTEEGLAVICDGMGGMASGRQASSLTVSLLLQQYAQSGTAQEPVPLLQSCAEEANRRVQLLEDPSGSGRQAGTTLAAVIVRNQALYWFAVGDSRGYLYRSGALLQFTLDQNFGTVLEEQLRTGQITKEEYLTKLERSEGLLSYIGISRLNTVDYSRKPLPLQSGDKILLMSDGLYRLLSDQELCGIVDNFTDLQEALQVLEMKAQRNAAQSRAVRDNMTVILIRIK